MHDPAPRTESPTPRRHFLGWDAPLLLAAADWLLERWGADLSSVTVVVPTRRAGRRLEALLLARRGAISRPAVKTVGELPDLLIPADVRQSLAGELACQLARLWALQRVHEAKPEVFRGLVPDPPKPDDFRGWQSLTRRLGQLRHELGAGQKTIEDVADEIDGDTTRWACLAAVESVYEAALADESLIDPYAARQQAIDAGEVFDGDVVLIGCADLNPMQSAVVDQMTSADALIFAPPGVADRFDARGGLLLDAWAFEPVPAADASIRVLDQHQDQAAAVVEQLAIHAAGRTEDDVAIGLGDESQNAAIIRAVERAGGRARSAVGKPLLITGPCLFLQAAANYLAGRRLPALAELVRHPDVDAWLRSDPTIDSDSSASISGIDNYLSDTLQQTLEQPPEERVELASGLKRVGVFIERLFQHGVAVDPMAERPLPEWSEPILTALELLYAGRELRPFDAADNATIEALTRLGSALREQQNPEVTGDLLPELTLPQAIDWTLARLGATAAADPPERGAIELMGLLDLYTDDAPVAVVTAVNEGYLPKTKVSDPFLPDGLRRRLGLPDAHRRVASDNYLLHTLAHSKESLTLIAARNTDNGDPLPPSRLLLQGPPEEAAARLQAFYAEDAPAQPIAPIENRKPEADNLIASGGFGPPLPEPQDEPLNRLSVTAFRDYLACPYRFYLKRVLKLDTLDDTARELDPAAFGNLIHDTLACFGSDADGPRESDDAELIADYLDQALLAIARKRYGSSPRAAVRVQAAFARERLVKFARLQAGWAASGWRIVATEKDFERAFETKSGEMLVHGRIDRIDHHPDLGCRLIDYKTSDTAKAPEKVHFRGKAPDITEWFDLQLPLYRDLVAGSLYAKEALSLGYVVLPRKLDDVGFRQARWDNDVWQQAAFERDRVIQGVLTQRFWPPGDPSVFNDGLSGLCADQWPDRGAYVHQVIGRAIETPPPPGEVPQRGGEGGSR